MKLLDRLMARQARLMSSLDKPAAATASRVRQASRLATLGPPHDPAAEVAASTTARSLLEIGDLSGARAALEPFIPTGRDVESFIVLARICTEQGDFQTALTALERAEALDPADRRVWQLVAKLLSTQRRHREALVYLRRLALVDAAAPAVAYVEWLRGLHRARDGSTSAPRVARAARVELQGVLERFKTAPGMTDAIRLQFSGLYYLLSDGSKDAIEIYNAATPCPATHHDVTAKLVSLDVWCAQRGLPMRRSDRLEAMQSGCALYTLGRAQIHPALGWVPILEEGRILAVGGEALQAKHFRATRAASPLMLFRGSRAELRLPTNPVVEEAPAILAGGSASYYDTLVNDLSGLAIAEGTGLAMDLPLVVPAGMAPFQRELLRLLGYATNRLIELSEDQPTLFHTLHVPARLARASRWVSPLVGDWYRKRLAGANSTGARRLFLMPGSDVSIANADEVVNLFASMDFERVDASALTVGEQIELFSKASHVVGLTSEAMTNLVFCPRGTKVFELRPMHWAASGGHMHFEQLATSCGHEYAVEECARAGNDAYGGLRVLVELARVRAHLERWS
jgi:capsular polysaccharide biosynthesis protein